MSIGPKALLAAVAVASLGCSADPGSPFDTLGSETVTDGTASAAPGETSSATSNDDDSGEGDGTLKLDVVPDETGGQGCAEEDCDIEWSYLWVANSSENTVSKIDTRTLVEEGRYATAPPGEGGNPSRTSVSVDARAVAVANRHVGITKIWARTEYCEDRNGNGSIDTSGGASDVLAFEEDECFAWYADFPGATVQRPVAWTTGRWDEDACEHLNQKIWTTTGTGDQEGTCGFDGPSDISVHRLDGDLGVIEDTVAIPAAELDCGPGPGPYGGAVDSDSNFWFQQKERAALVRVDFATLEYTIWNYQDDISIVYGLTVDSENQVWTDGMRFEPSLGEWEGLTTKQFQFGSGVAEDHQGRMWFSLAPLTVSWMDRDTLEVGGTVGLPLMGSGPGNVKGVSVDIDGFIWATPRMGYAFKIDPNTLTVAATEGGLVSPYTYSDMTGGQLFTQACGIPEG